MSIDESAEASFVVKLDLPSQVRKDRPFDVTATLSNPSSLGTDDRLVAVGGENVKLFDEVFNIPVSVLIGGDLAAGQTNKVTFPATTDIRGKVNLEAHSTPANDPAFQDVNIDYKGVVTEFLTSLSSAPFLPEGLADSIASTFLKWFGTTASGLISESLESADDEPGEFEPGEFDGTFLHGVIANGIRRLAFEDSFDEFVNALDIFSSRLGEEFIDPESGERVRRGGSGEMQLAALLAVTISASIERRSEKCVRDGQPQNADDGGDNRIECAASDETESGDSFDPNEKVGRDGVGDLNYIADTETLSYTVYFENDPELATLPAQIVTITDKLSPHLDWDTFEFGLVGFGDHTSRLEGFDFEKSARVFMPEFGLFTDVDAELDRQSGIVSWTFTTVDPRTGTLTRDPLAGFLPPNINKPEGEGRVGYRIQPLETVSTNTVIANSASIVFDTNDPIITNEHVITYDFESPNSTINPLSQTSPPTFVLAWSGNDVGAGVESFDIFVAVDDGPFELWKDDITATSAIFEGDLDHTYSFYSIATDRVGNVESKSAVAETSTLIQDIPAPGDFNEDGTIDAVDIDLLCGGIRTGDVSFDLTGDGLATKVDLLFLVETILETKPGDANLNGRFDSGDLVQVFGEGQYEDGISGNSGWAQGDWNCDNEFDTGDLVEAFQAGGYVAEAHAVTTSMIALAISKTVPNAGSIEPARISQLPIGKLASVPSKRLEIVSTDLVFVDYDRDDADDATSNTKLEPVLSQVVH